jgi:transposase InsO family protein
MRRAGRVVTYIRLLDEFAYLAVVLDAFSRRVVGWALEAYLEAQLAIAALTMALMSVPLSLFLPRESRSAKAQEYLVVTL